MQSINLIGTIGPVGIGTIGIGMLEMEGARLNNIHRDAVLKNGVWLRNDPEQRVDWCKTGAAEEIYGVECCMRGGGGVGGDGGGGGGC